VIGRTISHYQIVEKLGEGGMGVVYKARDTRLDRFVAIKVLSTRAVSNLDRQLRFVQEAKAASGLNHPNIITIYDSDTIDEFTFIAMEFVDGKTLEQLVRHKGLRVNDVLHYAVQIADALAAAHAAGIVHRDIKPANIMITDKGLVKVLDFGLAKRAPIGQSDSGSTANPITLTISEVPHTDEGVILGTVAYMSPEQAQGEKVDARSDIFSFGAVLYEMITGWRAFQGETKLSTLAAILNQEPKPPSEIVEGLPREVERTISRCLRKNPARRFQHMEGLKVALEELKEESDSGRLISPVSSAVTVPVRTGWGRNVNAAVLLTLIASFAAGSWIYLHRTSKVPGSASPTYGNGRLTLLLSSAGMASDPALSPDGKMIAYVAKEQGHVDLFVSRVAGGDRIRLTNDEARELSPHFSPDGERVVFTRIGSEAKSPDIWVVPVLGGQAARLVTDAFDAIWSPDGSRIALISRRPGQGDALASVAADGTDMRIHARSNETYPFFISPAWSPDGTKLAVVRSRGGMAAQLWLVPLNGSPSRLSSDAPGVFSSQPVFTPDGRGIIHQSNRGGSTNLWLQPLDGSRQVQLTAGSGPDEAPSVARDGAIVFANVRFRTTLVIHHLASGQTRELLTHSSYIWAPAFAPDGHELAFSREEMDGSWHIWMAPVAGGAARRLTSGATPEIYPRFSPDGASIIYHTWGLGANRIYRVPRTGGPSVALTPVDGSDSEYGDISPDGHLLAFARADKGGTQVYVIPVNGGESRRLIDSESTLPRWSPDGHWLAFSRSRAFAGGVWVIGADGSGIRRLSDTGSWPVWWPGGKQLGYLDTGPDGVQQIFIVPFEGGPPRALTALKFSGSNNPFDVSPDGTALATSNWVALSSEIWLLQPQR
jgi:Tol biopolymer transport system component/serine/threonine protein kinase